MRAGPDSDEDLVLGAFEKSPVFRGVDRKLLQMIAAASSVCRIEAGVSVMREGDLADSMYLVVTGRLRVSVDGDGKRRIVGEVVAGETVGEMGLLGDEHRSASVVAVRDSVLARLDRSTFEEVAHSEPRVLLEVARMVVRRLQDAIHRTRQAPSIKVLAVAPAGGSSIHREFAERLATELTRYGTVEVVEPSAWPEDAGNGRGRSARLHDLERRVSAVVLATDVEPSDWSAFCLRQADRVLLVGSPDESHDPNGVEVDLISHDGETLHVDLVVAGSPSQAETSRWLGARAVRRHHHVRDDAGYGRLARQLTGRAVHLVLSGGGARGIAHLGVVRALEEANIPIDAIAGTSFGAVVAAGVAQGLDLEDLTDRLRRALVDAGSLLDFTYPSISIASGARLRDRLTMVFDGMLIEDGVLPFFCVVSNLSAGRMEVIDRGPLVPALRASTSIPGIFPPVKTASGDVLVDGGIINNLPIDVMVERSDGGPIIGVNLKGDANLPTADLSEDGVASGWRLAARRHGPGIQAPEIPHLSDLLLRSTELGSVQSMAASERLADLIIRPDVSTYSLLDFTTFDEVVEAGYRSAVDALAGFSLGEEGQPAGR